MAKAQEPETTLPKFALQKQLPLDTLRSLVRKSEALKQLGRKVGPTRVYNAAELKQIREAFEQREAAKGVAHAS